MPSQPANSEDAAVKPEDPMRDAVALTERVELRGNGDSDLIVAGFHRDGRLSLYFGEDPYYQFDSQGGLRRALVGDRLFRTQGTRLAALTRVPTAGALVLARRDLDREELGVFVRAMLAQVGELREGLVAGALEAVRQVPSEAPIVERLAESLTLILSAAGALAPAINRMR
ncbi:MAG TPA: hypothetical protein VFG04_29265 [Planctomycetaceae bacterium]|jgi:hypothetical protein|nr:hypothetical protein [Planctomycetaceae bacterium]